MHIFPFLFACSILCHSIDMNVDNQQSSNICVRKESCLSNIQQVTFSNMGFEKAGEAYFSPDESTIIFQAVPKGQTQYQIYMMNLEEGVPRMVSTGKGACTCAFFRPDGKKSMSHF